MNLFKKALIAILSIGLVTAPAVTNKNVEVVEAASTPETLCLTPNSNWTKDNARFAAYFFGNGEKWVSMTDADKNGIYEVTVPSGYPNVIFCRMNPSASANNWNNKWNQTADLTVPTDGTNHYTVKSGTWDYGGGTWSLATKNYKYHVTTTSTFSPEKLELAPNSNWTQANARFAAYFFGNGETWVSMTDSDNNGTYEVTVPSGYPNVIFCRMNPSTTENNWDNKWNQTGDLIVPTDGTFIYTITEGSWDSGTWSGNLSENAHLTTKYQFADNNTSLRLVAIFGDSNSKENYTVDNYDEVGFELTYNGKTKSQKVRYVYSSLVANGETITAESEKGVYFFVFTFTNIPTEDFEMSYRAYAIKKGQTEKEYGAQINASYDAEYFY